MKTNKQIIDAYFTDNHKELKKYCLTLCNKISRPDLSDTLINTAYMYIVENEDKFSDVIQAGKIGGHVKNFVTKQIVWSNTKTKKEFVYLDSLPYDGETEEDEDTYLDQRNFVLPDEEEEMYEKEYDHQSKITHIEHQYNKLDVPTRILYNISIVGPYNTGGKLAKYLGINRNSTYHLRKNLIAFLKEGYNPNN